MTGADITGGCQCGAVRYRSLNPPLHAVHCHCRMCRKSSGAAFMTWVEFSRDGFSFTNGEPAARQSSERVKRSFCPQCGAQMTMDYENDPGIGVSVGTLDRPETIASAIDNIWTASRLPLVKGFDADLVSHPEFSGRG